MSCHIESFVVSCHIVPCCVMSCCFMCVVSCHVGGWSRHFVSCLVAFCHVLSCPCGGPQTACVRKLSFAKDDVSHTATDSDQIANGTPTPYLLIPEVFQKKKKERPLGFPSAKTRQTQRAQTNNAPEHDPRSQIFRSATTRQPSGQFGSWCCLSKKCLLHLLGRD